MKIAALFVEERGPYADLPDVEVWGISRDARAYAGPWKVVAHPPCERWGRYAHGGPSAPGKFKPGDDGGCFAAALAAVKDFGGVLEHPAQSRAWAAYGLTPPDPDGGWSIADICHDMTLWTCQVGQGFYGHTARKPTWLLASKITLPTLQWGSPPAKIRTRRPDGRPRAAKGDIENLSKRQRRLTPEPFRDLLIGMARSEGDQ